MSVRLAEEKDLDDLVDLLRDCVREMQSRGLDQWDDIYPNRSTVAADIQSGALYVSSSGAHGIAGAFTLNEHQDPEYADVAWQVSAQPVAVLHRLMVHPTLQRAGLARFLMLFAQQRAQQLGFGVIRLDTLLANTRALALYRALGYQQAGYVTFRKGLFVCLEKKLSSP